LKPTATGVRLSKDYKGAIADFTQALRLALTMLMQQTGNCTGYAGRYTGAMAEFDEALRKDPILLTPTTTEGLPTHR